MDEDSTLHRLALRLATGAHRPPLGTGAVRPGVVPMIFAHLTENGEKIVDGEVKNEVIARCPNVIFVLEHYRKDGPCRCYDPEAKEMATWGYEWDDKRKYWAAGDDA